MKAQPNMIETPAPAGFSVDARERLIVALDFPTANDALRMVDRLDGACQWFKVGLELYLAAGSSIVSTLKERGFSVFLDLKLHDIPNTVAAAVRSVTPLGADLLTVHALGGPEMLHAAAEAAGESTNSPRLLAVTVLTSMDHAQLTAIGVTATPGDQALKLAVMAYAAGIGGFVCSPEEVPRMRSTLPDSILVTPGIRPAGAELGDQKRVATPGAAVAAGSSFLVVGRPITQAHNPLEAVRHILDEIRAAGS